MAPGFSSTQEMAAASRKRPHSLSPSESPDSAEESGSDFGAPNETPKKPIKKKARTTKAPIAAPKDDILSKIPKAFRSEDGHALFSAKWWKEVVKCDEFWTALAKNTPKSVLQKRLKVEIMVDLNNEDKKDAPTGRKAAGTPAAKMIKAPAVRKTPTRKNEDATMIDAGSDVAVEDNVAAAAPAAPAKQNAQPTTQINMGDIGAAKPEVTTAQASKDTGNAEGANDILSIAIANPNTSAEERAQFIAIKEGQVEIMQGIEAGKEQKRLDEANRRKRIAEKEQRAAGKVDTAADAPAIVIEDTQAKADKVDKDIIEIDGGAEQSTDKATGDVTNLESSESKDE